MTVGEAFLSAFLQVLFDRLASRDFLGFLRQEGMKKKLVKWSRILSTIQAVLDDAEEKRLTSRAVKQWVDDLRDLCYDIEDIVDELATEALRRSLITDSAASTSKVRRHVSPSFANLRPSVFMFSISMGPKIKEITRRLEDLSGSITQLGLEMLSRGGTPAHVRQRAPSTSLLNEAGIFGRDEDKKLLLDMVLRDESSDVSFCVIPIVGMGGVGKTTLARLVYNDIGAEHFNVRAWVCLSEGLDVVRITEAVLESITRESCDLKEFNQLQVKLHEELKGKKFLIVLDDVWDKNYGDWEALLSPFRSGAPGSRIIVTTRSRDVASMIATKEYFDLPLISDDHIWSIFEKHACDKGDISHLPDLESIHEKVVEKSKGLPLAARTLGGLLRSKPEVYEWLDVLNSRLWQLSDNECDILPVLRLSYYHLPSHLKRCFAYCAIFPKGYGFQREELVLLWMAEGLIQSKEDQLMEDIGLYYFDDLFSRSFFQPSDEDDDTFLMHDLVNDLAQWAAGETCFRLEDELGGKRSSKISENVKYASFIRGNFDGKRKFDVFYGAKRLRTFLSVQYDDSSCGFLTNAVLDQLPELRRLRVLSLRGYKNFAELPSSIEKLKHLRYLDLSHTGIRSLPESICSLYNLQTLKLEDCRLLQRLPAKMGDLINLRHLVITNANSIKGMPLGIHKLTNLITLSSFVVGKNMGCKISGLKSLKNLQGSLQISSLENVTDAKDASEANLNDKEDLDDLCLEWSSKFDDSRNGQVERHVLEMLKPHCRLEELIIRGYAGTTFPVWIGDLSFSNMVALELENCKKCTSLPPVGQLPSLEELRIVGMHAIKSMGAEFYGESNAKPFPSLITLHVENMQELESWIPCGVNPEAFPSLEELSITGCPKLSGNLPTQLPLLERLTISQCEQFVVSIPSLPVICNIEIMGCKEVVNTSDVDFDSLKSIVVSNISNTMCLAEASMQGLTKAERVEIVGCQGMVCLWQNSKVGLQQQLTSTRYLVIESCLDLVSLVAEEEEVEEEQLQQCVLESLELKDCKSLKTLPQWFHGLKSLNRLRIEDCPRLVPFPVTCWPSMLRMIWIKNCNAFSALPKAVSENSYRVRLLCIDGCDSLISIRKGQLPPTLEVLEITSCKNLETLLDEEENSSSSFSSMRHEGNTNSNSTGSSLLVLVIDNCQSLVSLSPQVELPSTLKSFHVRSCSQLTSLTSGGNLPEELEVLEIVECPKLEAITMWFQSNMSIRHMKIQKCESLKSLPDGLHNLRHVTEIIISECPVLLSFPEEGLPNKNLRMLSICSCKKLKALPVGMHNLTSLQELVIFNCPAIVSFPENGFPTNLVSLRLTNFNICNPLLQWGLYRLTSLRCLVIKGGCPDVASFPDEDIMLPNSLTSLTIGDFPNLKRLSTKGFQKLTLLESLYIDNCPKLASFPNKGLSPSILQLYITNCSLLKGRCEKDKGEEWSKIAYIPLVVMDYVSSFDPNFRIEPVEVTVSVTFW